MTIPPMHPLAGMVGIPAEDRRAVQQDREQNRIESELTQRAAGDGESTATEAAADRDADGRQGWRRRETPKRSAGAPPSVAEESTRPHSRDPYHQSGNHLDLDG
jgi:hypothetical protein